MGVIFHSPESKFGHAVQTVKKTSALEGQLRVGDVIVAVDGSDTSALDFNKIAELLMRKEEATRVLTVLR